jgi:hypothetical protein
VLSWSWPYFFKRATLTFYHEDTDVIHYKSRNEIRDMFNKVLEIVRHPRLQNLEEEVFAVSQKTARLDKESVTRAG